MLDIAGLLFRLQGRVAFMSKVHKKNVIRSYSPWKSSMRILFHIFVGN